MASRNRKAWRPNRDGQFERRLGWAVTRSGRLDQPKFRLGTDLREARRREMMLTELWEQIERTFFDGETVRWPDKILELAKQIARYGEARIPKRDDDSDSRYASRVASLAEWLPTARILPADPDAFRRGVDEQSKKGAEFAALYEKASDLARERMRQALTKWGGPAADSNIASGPTLHDALRDHIAWLKEEYADRDGSLTAWGKVRVKQAEVLLDRHDDIRLAQLGQEQLEEMVRFWRQRPLRKGSDRPIAKKSAEHQIAALRYFVRWLSRSTEYDWRKPEAFDEIRSRVGNRADEMRRQVTPEDMFTLDELVLLNRHATPFERLLLLLGINCGFGRAEIASLTVGEVFLRTTHEPRHQEILGFHSTHADSFIKRYRRKTGVYGEHILFPQTVAGIEWALARRHKHPGFGPAARLLVNSHGEPLDKPTAGGNPNQQIPNAFARLIRRVQESDEGKGFVRRPFKMLRKTAGDLIRRQSDGEVTAVFHCRGQAVRIDDLADAYTNRPFGRVFRAIREVEQHLQPVFKAAGDEPFAG